MCCKRQDTRTEKQLETILALYYGIANTTELAARTLWNEQQFGCSVGALVPVNLRTEAYRARLLNDPAWWAKYDKDILYMTANTNNAFVGSDRKRQKYMLRWTRTMYYKLKSGVNIVEGSDLRVPHFKVPNEKISEPELTHV